MIELVGFPLEGQQAYVEIADDEPGVVAVSRLDDVISAASGSLEEGLDRVRSVAQAALRRLVSVPEPPEEVTIEFGVRFNAKVGAVIAQTEGAGHLQVTMTWKRPPPAPPASTDS